HRLQFERIEARQSLGKLAVEFRLEARVLVAQFAQCADVRESSVEFLIGFDQGVERLQLVNDLPGLILIVPESGLTHAGGETIALGDLAGYIKESPGDGPNGWSSRRCDDANRRS